MSREQLAVLVPELLLIGQLIDRSGMAWCISSFGRDEMVQIAIEEWAGASPVYTRRMQQALNYEGVDVVTIFKGLQLDIGAPPQFMDFRYTVHDRWHGEFHLDHCGALLDVEPMGEQYVFGMCHTIEDPTFDATAVAAVLCVAAGLVIGDARLVPSWPGAGWLLTLALSSQVLGWLIIAATLPRLPAAMTSLLLTVQPIGSTSAPLKAKAGMLLRSTAASPLPTLPFRLTSALT